MPEPMDKNIKIVLLNASPAGMAARQLDEEARAIERKIRASEYCRLIDFVPVSAVRPDDLLQALNTHQPHVVQFSGHGNDRDEIIVCDDSGAPKPVSKEALVSLFKSVPGNVQVVVLNTCYSTALAKAIVSIVPCAVGMNGAIGGEAARVFASSFYRAIGFGCSVQEAFQQGNVALKLEGMSEADLPQLLTRDGVDPARVILINPTFPTLLQGVWEARLRTRTPTARRCLMRRLTPRRFWRNYGSPDTSGTGMIINALFI